MIEISGIVENIIFYNEHNHYSIALLKTEDGSITIVGHIPYISVGMPLSAEGDMIYHETYGEQFSISKVNMDIESDAATMKLYLSSGAIVGIGPVIAERIVNAFGDKTLDVFKNSPQRLMEVQGIGKATYEKIIDSFDSQEGHRDVLIKISGYGISMNLAQKLYDNYGEQILPILENNPYDVLENVSGFGFKVIYNISLNAFFEKEDDNRLEAALAYVLSLSLNEGHSYLPKDVLLRKTSELLGIGTESLEPLLDRLAMNKNVHILIDEGEVICYNMSAHIAENYIANRVIEISKFAGEMDRINIDERIEQIEKIDGIAFGEEQKTAIYETFNNGSLIITGGPGTGKTTTLNAIIKIGEALGYKIKLIAPTGRAANRMAETTNREAQTIHRLLEYQFAGDSMEFARDEDNPIEADIVIVDEMSMVDVNLFFNLLKAVSQGTRIVMVGDTDQLPSVGAGNVLRDLISSEVIKVVTLDVIFRQDEASAIVSNAHKINKGSFPIVNENGSDFFMFKSNSQEETLKLIVELVSKRLPKFYGYDPVKDIQVLTPMRKGKVGVNDLNILLQKSLNKPSINKGEIAYKDTVFRVGDKVMQIKNNYQLEWTQYDEDNNVVDIGMGIYNGDIGYISSINNYDDSLVVIFDNKRVVYEQKGLDELALSYATTIHKSQGSEFPVVIMPIHYAPHMLLTRNLLYTGITRAKSLVVLVGEERFLRMMIQNNYIADRYSGLDKKIKNLKDVYGE
ncbi:MAG: ATP-dependent RecD-like DNA helicase [Tissierellia bacterium]|nr:ATP-dependent RecD-like DNA helicase [Tissierellia bacterium]